MLFAPTTFPVCFRTTTPGAENGFFGGFPAPDIVIAGRGRPVAGRAPELPPLRKVSLRKGVGRPMPRLRRKTGLCYTAGAISPVEAYIYVC